MIKLHQLYSRISTRGAGLTLRTAKHWPQIAMVRSGRLITSPTGENMRPPELSTTTIATGVPPYGATGVPPYGATGVPPYGATGVPPYGATGVPP